MLAAVQSASPDDSSETLGLVGVPVFRWRPVARRQFEAGELERWSDDAADETPVSEGLFRLPRTCRDHHLWPLACRQVVAEAMRLDWVAFDPDGHVCRRPGVVAPDLRHVLSMPVTAVSGTKQEIDTAHKSAASVRRNVLIDLPVVTALGMGLETENSDDVVASHVCRHFDLYMTS